MAEFRMPSLGADMEAGTLVEWLVHPGDTVHRGDIVAVVETEKATIEVEVFTDGVVEELLVNPGTKVPVGTPLAHLGGGPPPAVAPTGVAPAQLPPAAVTPSTPVPATGGPLVASPLVRHLAAECHVPLDGIVGSGPGGLVRRADVEAAAAGAPPPAADGVRRPRVTPRARRRAAALGVDPATAVGTGPGGAVTAEDVEHAAATRAPAPMPTAAPAVSGPAAVTPPPTAPATATPTEAGRVDRTAMRRAIARLMDRANREIPHFYLASTVDLGTTLAWLAEENARRSIKDRLLPAVLLLKAVALAAQEVPGVSGSWVDERFVPAERLDLGVAVSLRGGGLVTPVIPDAANLALDELSAALQAVIARARTGRLRGSDLAEGALTVTNLGDQGVEVVYGVIHPPQVALVGIGTVTERPWARDGMVGARPTVVVTLAADHRAIDGRLGSGFLTAIDRHLQRPEQL